MLDHSLQAMARPMHLLPTLVALATLLNFVTLESVPVFLWSNQPDPLRSGARYSTLVDHIEPDQLLGDYLKRKVPVVAFVQKNLDVEQFSANDASFVSSLFENTQVNPVFFSNVNNPRKVFSSFKEDGSIENENVAIYLTGKDLKQNDDIIKSYTEKFNSSGPVVFMLTGENNEILRGNKRSRRQAAAKETSEKILLSPPDAPCILVSVTSATVTIDAKDSVPEKKVRFITPKIETAECNAANAKKAEKLTLKFTEETGSAPSELRVTWNFTSLTTESETNWRVNSLKIESTSPDLGTLDSKNFQLSVADIFSYSCQNSIVSLATATKDKTGFISFESLQLQPYFNLRTTHTKAKFEDSSDCAVWFTLPIWSGLIVILILVTILYFGIIALMSISTPDRFENPKGRGLIITNFDE